MLILTLLQNFNARYPHSAKGCAKFYVAKYLSGEDTPKTLNSWVSSDVLTEPKPTLKNKLKVGQYLQNNCHFCGKEYILKCNLL